MISVILATYLALSCPETEVINHTKTWTEKDQRTLTQYKKRCSKIPNNECLIKFEKVEDLFYRVYCGRKR